MDDRIFKNLPLTKFILENIENPQTSFMKSVKFFVVFVLQCI